jgi:hypothetical protein
MRDWQNYIMLYRLFRLVSACGVFLAAQPVACAASSPSSATAASAIVAAQRLEISLACPALLHVGTERGLERTMKGHWPGNATVTREPDGTVRLSLETCPLPDAGSPAPASVDVVTAPAMPLAIEAPQARGITLDDRTGPVFVHTGSGHTRIGTAETLDLIADTAGQIDIPILPDSARIRSTGTAVITIGAARGTALSVYLGGASSFLARTGRLKALEITSASTKDALFHGQTEVAALHVESSGSIIVDKVSGTLATERDGPGHILVNQDQPPTQPSRTTAQP